MRVIILVVLTVLVALLLIEAGFSLAWPIAHDEAPLFYEAFLMRAEGRVPYRDIYDFQMPGAYAAFYALGLLSSFDPLRIRILDLALLAGLMTLTFLWMRGFGWKPALAAVTLFGLKYLEGGPSMALQREFLLLIPVAMGLWLYMHNGHPLRRRLLIGLCFGLAAIIKPHAAIGLAPVLLMEVSDLRKSRAMAPLSAALTMLGGFLIPAAVALIWLDVTGALAPFLEIATHYWPLYAQINGQLVVTTGAARWALILDQVWRLAGNGIWILPAALGVYLSFSPANRSRPPRRNVILLIWLTVCYALYPAFSGQFFQYHYVPFLYFAILLSSLCLIEIERSHWRAGALAALVIAMLVNVRVPAVIVQKVQGKPYDSGGRADQIAAYLRAHLESGDTVQPLDWTGGTLQAMLTTRARLATTFVFDFYFYHHVSEPYIQALRVRFMDEIRAAPPTYVVEVLGMDRPWIGGPDTSQEFPELRALLAEGYTLEVARQDYNIYGIKK